MNLRFLQLTLYTTLLTAIANGQGSNSYTNIVRQIQVPSGVKWDATVPRSGDQVSHLEIGEGGARFELWTVLSDPLTSYLLDSTYVGAYAPVATVAITSEDPNTYNDIPRTRADRPFRVDIVISGLRSGDTDPEASKKVHLLHHTQSYGVKGVGLNLERNQATLNNKAVLDRMEPAYTLSYGLTSISGSDRSKIRGEERFSVYTLLDNRPGYKDPVPPLQLASQTIQIWPVADATIDGIKPGDTVRFKVPQLTLTLNDLYPKNTTYAQVYKGPAVLGTVGTVMPGSERDRPDDGIPQDDVLFVKDYADLLGEDGEWTIEVLTETPFGIDRLTYVTFNLNRTMSVRGTLTTYE